MFLNPGPIYIAHSTGTKFACVTSSSGGNLASPTWILNANHPRIRLNCLLQKSSGLGSTLANLCSSSCTHSETSAILQPTATCHMWSWREKRKRKRRSPKNSKARCVMLLQFRSPATNYIGQSKVKTQWAWSSAPFSGIAFTNITRPLFLSTIESIVRIPQEHLVMHDLDPKQGSFFSDIGFTLPPFLGSNIHERFHRIGSQPAQPWLNIAKDFASSELPPKSDHWDIRSGWTRYYFLADGSSYSKHVDFPQREGNVEEVLTFDVEAMPAYHPYAIMACTTLKKTWYTLNITQVSWGIGWATTSHSGDTFFPRVIAGHGVCYDRARILEEYSLHGIQSRFRDTMTLNVAVSGISFYQRPD